MAFEKNISQEERIKHALSDQNQARFRAKPYENQNLKKMAYGFRRIGQTYSIRPDLVAKVNDAADEQHLSRSNLVEQILMAKLMPQEITKENGKDE